MIITTTPHLGSNLFGNSSANGGNGEESIPKDGTQDLASNEKIIKLGM